MRKAYFFLLALFGFGILLVSAQESESTEEAMPQAGDTRTDAFGIEQVYVPAGCFMMGISAEEAEELRADETVPSWAKGRLSSEQPQHEVCLTQGYWLDKYEVTNQAFQAFIDAGGYTDQSLWSEEGWRWLERQAQRGQTVPAECEDTEADHPRVCVTWFEADAYARWRGGALPTEAQWEFAARSPENFRYPWGNEWDETRANVVNSTGLTAVGAYPTGVSWVGAHDMAGNAMEWVADWLSPDYERTGDTDPTGVASGRMKVERGGWWGSNSFVARSTYRHFEDPPSYQDHHIGFRIVSPAGEAP